MARKGGKGKPTRKDINAAISNLHKGILYLGQKLEYLEAYAKSTEMALDLYTKFKKDDKKFTEYINKYNKEQEKALEKETKKE